MDLGNLDHRLFITIQAALNQFHYFRADYSAVGNLVGVTQGGWALTLGLGELLVCNNVALFFTKYLQLFLPKETYNMCRQ